MRSLLSLSCFFLPSLSKHLSLIIALHKSFEQFILLTGGQSGRKLDIDTEEIAFLFFLRDAWELILHFWEPLHMPYTYSVSKK